MAVCNVESDRGHRIPGPDPEHRSLGL